MITINNIIHGDYIYLDFNLSLTVLYDLAAHASYMQKIKKDRELLEHLKASEERTQIDSMTSSQ